jgi:hypothetical protein
MGYQFNPLSGQFDIASTGASQVNSDWNASSGVAQILNKPSLATVATSGSYADLLNKPTLFSGSYVDLTNKPSSFTPSAHASTHASGGSDALTLAATQITSGTLADAQLSSNVPLIASANSFSAGQTITAAANTSALTASYSVTGANTTPLLNLTGTWNTSGVATGLKLNITDTASNASSLLMDLQVAGTSQFNITKTGFAVANRFQGNGYANSYITWNGSGGYQFAVFASNSRILYQATNSVLGTINGFGIASTDALSPDVFLYRDAANTLAQRNGTNAQLFRIYNTYTDASNSEFLSIDWTTTANTATISTKNLGTGTARDLKIAGGVNTNIDCGGGGSTKLYWAGTQKLSVGSATSTFSNTLVLSASNLRQATSVTPASATATGTTGDIQWDANYIYVCTATNTWKRAALATW